MELESGKQLISYIRKYRIVLLIAVLGVILMGIPQGTESGESPQIPQAPAVEDLEQELTEILGSIAGVGKARVLLTEDCGSDTIYQTDTGQDHSRLDTVVLTGADRAQTGLIRQILPPVYRGALVVCQGADRAGVRLAVVEAVKSVTGLSSDRITVLKMK